MSRFLDNPPSEESVPLFPKGTAYNLFLLGIVIDAFAIVISPAAIDWILAIISFGLAVVPFFFIAAPWLTRVRHVLTGALVWVLFTAGLGLLVLFLRFGWPTSPNNAMQRRAEGVGGDLQATFSSPTTLADGGRWASLMLSD